MEQLVGSRPRAAGVGLPAPTSGAQLLGHNKNLSHRLREDLGCDLPAELAKQPVAPFCG
jgi:hypothetical protein